MSDQVVTGDTQMPKYTLSVDYMPDKAAVQCVTIRNNGMSPKELGEFVTEISELYRPLKFVIINEVEESHGTITT